MAHTKQRLATYVSLLTLAVPGVAFAQARPASGGTEAQADTGGLQDIIVTAQRRSERQQDVPIAIASLSALTAERTGVSGTETLSIAVPGLQFSRQTANGGAPFLRGVGSSQAAQGSESPVAVYVDDVYIGSPGASTLSFNNIEQIDVLKGPQGTLFGRNATGGVVQIRTKRPSQDASVSGRIGFGNFETYDASLYATGGVTDTLAVNFAGTFHDQRDGYGRNINTNQEVNKQRYWGIRGGALWEPSDASSLLILGDYSRNDGDAGLAVTIAPGTIASGGGTFPGRYNATAFPRRAWSENIQYGFSARFDHDFDWFRLASITAFRRNTIDYNVDNDASIPVVSQTDAVAKNRTFSQEVQFLSPTDSKLQWVAGLFYYATKAGYDPLRISGSSQASVGGFNELTAFQRLKSYSGFAEASYEIFPATKLTAGLRYTSDHFDLDATRRNAAGLAYGGTPFSRGAKFSKLTYRAVLDHKFTDDIMAYGSYSRGFKSGGFNVSAPTITVRGVAQPAPAVAPEVLDAFEIGLKTELFDKMLRLNLAAFKYDYKNLQVTVIGVGTSSTVNAAAAKIKGIDVDFEARPFQNLTVSGGISILDAKFSSFPAGPLLVPNPAACTPAPTTTGPLTGGNATCAADLTGFRTPRSPKFTGSISATYTIPASIGDFALTGSLYHNSGYAWDADNRLKQPKYTLLNATLSWTSPDQTYEVRVWGKNLTDKYYFNYVSGSASRDGLVADAPRTYGVSLGFRY